MKSLEVDIWDGGFLTGSASTSSMLATMGDCWEAGFQKLLNESGSGIFKIAKNDPKAVYVVKDNLVRMKVDGSYRFDWIIESIKTVQASDDPSKEVIAVGGRGLLAYFDRAIIYPDGWPGTHDVNVIRNGQSLGRVLYNFLTDAKARGAIPAALWDFTTGADSSGSSWTDNRDQQFRAGVNYYDLVRQFCALGIDASYHFQTAPTAKVVLSLYNALGADHSASVVLSQGKDFGGSQDLQLEIDDAPVRSRLLVEGNNGLITETAIGGIEADVTVGRREGYLSYPTGGSLAELVAAGKASIELLSLEAKPIQVSVLSGDAPFTAPFRDYDVGDTITIDAAPTF